MALDDLIAALSGTNKTQRASNPYLQGRDAFSQMRYQPSSKETASGKPNLKNQVMFALTQSLAQGLLGGLGERQVREDDQSRAMRFTNALKSADPASMVAADPELSQYAMPLQMEKYKRDLARQDALDAINMKADADLRTTAGIVSDGSGGYKQDPQLVDALVGVSMAKAGKQPRGQGPALPPSIKMTDGGPDFGTPTVRELERNAFQENIADGRSPTEAGQSARAVADDIRRQAATLYAKPLKEQADKSAAIAEIIRKGEEGIATAGTTGSPMLNRLNKLGAIVGYGDTEAKAQGDALLAQTRQAGIAAQRVVGSGSQSDMESAALMAASMSPDQTRGQNEKLLEQYKMAQALQQEKTDFLNYFLTKSGGNPQNAMTMYDLYLKENPMVVQSSDGEYGLNPSRRPWQQYNFQDAYKNFLGGGQGQQQAPQMEAPAYQMTAPQQQADPQNIPPGMMLQRNRRTGETRLVPAQ